MNILIDGYNLIFECGLHGRQISADSLSRARELLLSRIKSRFSPAEQSKVVVVFDAKKVPLSGQQAEEFSGGVKVLYSINFEDADELIETLIAGHAAPKQLLVVSSDHRLQKAAMKRKAQTTDSGDWYDQLAKQSVTQTTKYESSPRKRSESPLLTDEELAVFKDDVDDQIDRYRRNDPNWP